MHSVVDVLHVGYLDEALTVNVSMMMSFACLFLT